MILAKSSTKSLTYLENNRTRMNYPEYRRQGLPPMSGLVESLIKQFNYRVKGTEKSWLLENAESILQVRAGLAVGGRASGEAHGWTHVPTLSAVQARYRRGKSCVAQTIWVKLFQLQTMCCARSPTTVTRSCEFQASATLSKR